MAKKNPLLECLEYRNTENTENPEKAENTEKYKTTTVQRTEVQKYRKGKVKRYCK